MSEVWYCILTERIKVFQSRRKKRYRIINALFLLFKLNDFWILQRIFKCYALKLKKCIPNFGIILALSSIMIKLKTVLYNNFSTFIIYRYKSPFNSSSSKLSGFRASCRINAEPRTLSGISSYSNSMYSSISLMLATSSIWKKERGSTPKEQYLTKSLSKEWYFVVNILPF